MQGNPTVETVVSLYSGIVQVKDDGTASVDFELPDFNGTVRVMAVAWSKDKVGHGSGDLIVRNAVALTVAVPRFMTLGDEVKLGFDMHNVDGPAAAYKLALSQKQGDDTNETLTSIADKTVDLKTGERDDAAHRVQAGRTRSVDAESRRHRPERHPVKREMTFEVLPPAGDIKRTTISSLKPNGGKLSVDARSGPGSDPVADAHQPVGRPGGAPRRADAVRSARSLSLRLRRADGIARHAARRR